MSHRTENNFLDADRLYRDYLIVECIWDPSAGESDGGEPLHPELLRYLHHDAIERGDFTLRYWRGDFYHFSAGRYVRVSNSEMKSRIVRHLKEHNSHNEIYNSTAGQHIRITEPSGKRCAVVPGGKRRRTHRRSPADEQLQLRQRS